MQSEQELLAVIFPPGTFEWFDLTTGTTDEQNIYFTLVEKDLPPTNQPVVARKFHDITITDFPIRGKRTLLTFRRRYWKVEGQKELLKRDIPLTFPGTQLATEFAHFLKAAGRNDAGVARLYRRVSLPPSQRI